MTLINPSNNYKRGLPLSIEPFVKRRLALAKLIQEQGGGVVFIPTNLEVQRNADSAYPFRFDSYFYYLTQFTEPDAVLVMWVDGALPVTFKSLFFCNPKDESKEIWDGYRYGPDVAREIFCFDEAHPIDSVEAEVKKLLVEVDQVFCPLSCASMQRFPLAFWRDNLKKQVRGGKVFSRIIDVTLFLDEMRLKKDASELELMRAAAKISAAGHIAAMKACSVGMREYELEAEILYVFRAAGADAPAYNTIVGTGSNSCILHYRADREVLRDGDMVLIDAGAEFLGYAGDITRTFPTNGKFSSVQKDLYELVLNAQLQAIEAVKAGNLFDDPHRAAVAVLTEGMFDLKLLHKNKHGSIEDAIEQKSYMNFYMHRTSHWLGLDVHDVGLYRNLDGNKPSRVLENNMVLTIEPGIYVRPSSDTPEIFWNIGIRIEDDVLVRGSKADILSEHAPKTIAEIEKLMTSTSE